MYEDEFPTATSAQEYLNFHGWLREKVKEMTDRLLRDFSASWTGERDVRPPQSLHDETCELQRQQEKADSSGTLDGTIAYQFGDDGLMTLIVAGRQHIEVSIAAQDQLLAVLLARPVPADILQGPPASANPLPGASSGIMSSNTPMTNQQMSVRQNELTLNYLKAKRR